MFRRLGSILRTSIFILGGATALLYAGLGFLSYSLVAGLDDLENENRLLATGGALYAGLIRYDTAVRGFYLTGDLSYLELQEKAHTALSVQMKNLRELTFANASQFEKVRAIERHLENRYRHAEAVLSQRNYAPLLADTAAIAHIVDASKSYEAVAQLIDELTAESSRQQRLRAERRKEFLWAFWLVLGFGALILAAITAYFWDETHRLVNQGERSVEETNEAAHHDALTGLPNRRLLDRRVDAALARVRDTRHLALLMLDLDGFKAVNDGLGHSAGDELLKEVGHRLRATVRTRDLVVRLGGDEFVVFVDKYENKGEVRELASRLLVALQSSFDIAGESLRIGVSIGLCFATDSYASLPTMLRHADKALYAAKRAGKGRIREYSSGCVEDASDST